jgi:hypothetical protein
MSDPKDPDYYARLEKSIFKRKLQPTPDKEAKKPRSSAMPPNDGTPPDFWSQLPRDQQVELKEDLTKHFRLRFEANNAIVQWFRKECLRDPTLEEVTKIRSRAIQRLEPKVREEVLKRKREVATEHQKLKSSLLPPEDRKTPDRDEQVRQTAAQGKARTGSGGHGVLERAARKASNSPRDQRAQGGSSPKG